MSKRYSDHCCAQNCCDFMVQQREGECITYHISFREAFGSCGAGLLCQSSQPPVVVPLRDGMEELYATHSVSSQDNTLSIRVSGGQSGGEYKIEGYAKPENCDEFYYCIMVKVNACR